MKAIHRLFEYLEYKGIKPTRFEKDHGLSNGYLGTTLKRDGDLGSTIVEIIVNNCLDLNIEWLIAGKGSMLKEDPLDHCLQEPRSHYHSPPGIEAKDETISVLRDQVLLLKEYIATLKEDRGSSTDGQKRKDVS